MIERLIVKRTMSNAQRRWWIGIALILMAAAIVRLTGYNFGLPYIDQPDEPIFSTIALHMRGLYYQSQLPGYPPGILYLNVLAQVGLEQVTHRAPLDGLPTTIAVVRLLAIATSLFTVLVVGLLARKLSGDLAGWLAAIAWIVIPIIAHYSILALAEPWLLLCTALAFYWALIGLESDWPGWLILSVIAGLVAVIFKYSAYPLLGPGVAAALWRLRTKRGQAARILIVQMVCMAAVAAWLFFGYGAGQLTAIPGESSFFTKNALSRVINIPLAYSFLGLTISQIGLHPLVLALLVGGGTWAFAQRVSRTKLIGWMIVLSVAFLSGWLVVTYTPNATEGRYQLVSDLGIVVLVVTSLVEIARWLQARTKQPWVQAALVGGFAVVWLAPQSVTTLRSLHDKTIPDTRAALATWSSVALGDGSILVNQDHQKTFSREWGGYLGPYRIYLIEQVTSRALADWRRDYVNYAEFSEHDRDSLQQSDAGRALLDQMLLLKHFPPAGQDWRGPDAVVYRLWKMDHPTQVVFGKQIRLVGYDQSATQASPGDSLSLRFYWQALARPASNYSVYIHLNPLTSRDVIAQADGAPASNRPTLSWDDPDETLIGAPFELKIPPTLASGSYRVLVGLYDYTTGQRLLTESGDDYVQLFTLTVQ